MSENLNDIIATCEKRGFIAATQNLKIARIIKKGSNT